MIEFRSFPKIPRLFRDCVITEKIDGTNGAVGIVEYPFGFHVGGTDDDGVSHDEPEFGTIILGPAGDDGLPGHEYVVYAQSRNRIISPKADNHGFATWVAGNAEALVKVLGPGLHFGEWWGSGINRGYGLPNGEKRFSLFNTSRWGWIRVPESCGPFALLPPGLDVVPVLYEGAFSTEAVREVKEDLRRHGSHAAPFGNPEGVVVYHAAGNFLFKSTLDNDEVAKAQVVRRELALAA